MTLAPDEVLTPFSSTLAALDRRVLARSSDPESWHRYRRGGVTATFIRDLMIQIDQKGKTWNEARKAVERDRARPFSGNQYTDWGNLREPVIMEWVERKFSIAPSDALIHQADVLLHLATPDGIGVDYDDRLRLAEVKTSKHDLDPGSIDSHHVLQMANVDGVWSALTPEKHFWRTGYYDQMQWQMWVTGANSTLFVWEQHDNQWPVPTPLSMEPQYCWVRRDDRRIGELVEVANWYLANREDLAAAEADNAADYAELTAQYAEADRKVAYWARKRDEVKALIDQRIGPDVESFSTETESASVALYTTNPKPTFDEALWAKRAPKAYEALQAAKKRYTKQPPRVRTLRITVKNKNEEQE